MMVVKSICRVVTISIIAAIAISLVVLLGYAAYRAIFVEPEKLLNLLWILPATLLSVYGDRYWEWLWKED